MKSRIEFIIYIAGLIPLGLFYAPLKTWFGEGPWFMLALLAYVVILRGIGALVRRRINTADAPPINPH